MSHAPGRPPLDWRRIEVVDDRVAEILRRKTPAERLQLVFSLSRLARQVMKASVHFHHPDWTDEQLRAEVARRWSHAAAR